MKYFRITRRDVFLGLIPAASAHEASKQWIDENHDAVESWLGAGETIDLSVEDVDDKVVAVTTVKEKYR